MKVCDHASSRIRRVPRTFRYSGGEAIDSQVARRGRLWFLHSHGKRRSPSVNSSRGCPRVAGQPALTGRNVGPQGTRQWGQISPCGHHRGARRPAYL